MVKTVNAKVSVKKKENIVSPVNACGGAGTTQLTLFDNDDEDPFGYRDNFQW